MNDLPVPLEAVNAGQWAEVTDVTGEPVWVGRLAEMGLRNGTCIQMLQPGEPCLIRVGGARLSVRADGATHILVRPVATLA